MCFGGSQPQAQPYKPTPKTTDPAAEAAAVRERLIARMRKGRQSTILTSQNEGNQTKTTLGGGEQ